MKTVRNKSRISIWLRVVSGLSGPEAVRTIRIPTIPKAIDAYINTFVAIFSIASVYQNKKTSEEVLGGDYLAPGARFELATN
jgi:hypothetical protein